MNPDAHLQAQLHERIAQRLPGVQGVWLFGSVARGEAGPASDIDLAVLGESPFDPVAVFDLGLELGVLAQRDVDLVDLRRAPIVLRKVILETGSLVRPADAPSCEAFAADTAALYVAFRDELALADPARRGSP